MTTAERLIAEIVAAAQIPSEKRRRDVARELRGHMEDFEAAAREAGHGADEIERMIRANFGDPREIARNFGWVYRRERALARLAVFAVSTLTVAMAATAGIVAMQAGMGTQTWGRHTTIEALDILATAAAYVGMLSLERVLAGRGRWKAIWAVAAAGGAALAAHAAVVAMGCGNAVFLRLLRGRAARWVAAPAGFGLLGLMFWARSHGAYPMARSLANWAAMGVGYQAMTVLAARMDAGLWRRLQ